MEELLQIIHQNIGYAHWIIFGSLLLAGLNIPVSEDAMLFISALLASTYPDRLWELFIAVFMGALLSDFICFSLGYFLGPHIFELRLFKKLQPKISRVSKFYEKYGIATLFFGRFIPFGVRNGLFLTAGIGRMKPIKFVAIDTTACIVSCSIYFTLYYKLGQSVVAIIQQANIVIFAVAAIIVVAVIIRKFARRPKTAASQ